MKNIKKDMILIVDDNPQNLKLLGNILESNNYDTAIAMNGKQALEFIDSELPDLVLLDVMMPDMDGYEVCRSIKKNRTSKDIPVIFLTARKDIDDLVKGFEAGGIDYVTKPFNSTELLVRMKTHLDLKKARDEIVKLKGIVPICSNCKKIRNDQGYWEMLETFIESHSDAAFSHGICDECMQDLYGDILDKNK